MIRQSLVAAMAAGVISLDITAFGPWMIAQPLVAGPLFGWFMGNIAAGIIVGGIVQLLWMDVTPVGVGIPYDTTAVTILTVFWVCQQPTSSLSQIVLALAIAVPFGVFFRKMDSTARRLNTRILHRLESVSDERLPNALSLAIIAGLSWSFLRYTLTYFVVMLAGAWAWSKLGYFPKNTFFDHALTMAAILLPVAGMANVLDLFLSEEPDGRWLARLGFKPPRAGGHG